MGEREEEDKKALTRQDIQLTSFRMRFAVPTMWNTEYSENEAIFRGNPMAFARVAFACDKASLIKCIGTMSTTSICYSASSYGDDVTQLVWKEKSVDFFYCCFCLFVFV